MKLLALAACTAIALAGCDSIDTSESPLVASGDRFDRTAEIINDTSVAMTRLHAQNATTGVWTANLFQGQRLSGRTRTTVDVDDGTGECIYNFRATFADGDRVTRDELDVCRLGWWRVYSVRRRR